MWSRIGAITCRTILVRAAALRLGNFTRHAFAFFASTVLWRNLLADLSAVFAF